MFSDKLKIIFYLLLIEVVTSNQISQKGFDQISQNQQEGEIENFVCSQPIIMSDSTIQLGRCNKYLFTTSILIDPEHNNKYIAQTLSNLSEQESKNNWNMVFDVVTGIQAQISKQVFHLILIKIQDKFCSKTRINLMQINRNEKDQNQIYLQCKQITKQVSKKSRILGTIELDLQPFIAKNNILIYLNQNQGNSLPGFIFYLSKNYNSPSYVYYQSISIPFAALDNSVIIRRANHYSYQLDVSFFSINRLFLQNKNIIPSLAIISSATEYFTLSKNLYEFVINNFFNQCSQQKFSQCSCTQLESWPTFELKFGQTHIYLTPQKYMHRLSSGLCTFYFQFSQSVNDNTIELGSSLFYSTFRNDHTDLDENSVSVTLIDFTFIQVSLYILLATIILFSILAVVMLWKYRVVKTQKYSSRFYQISLSSRFLDRN